MIETIFNVKTNEVTIKEYVPTEEDKMLAKEHEAFLAKLEAESLAIKTAKETAQAKLAALGLTADEIAALSK